MGRKKDHTAKNIFETFTLARDRWFYILEIVLKSLEIIISTVNVITLSRSGIYNMNYEEEYK